VTGKPVIIMYSEETDGVKDPASLGSKYLRRTEPVGAFPRLTAERFRFAILPHSQNRSNHFVERDVKSYK